MKNWTSGVDQGDEMPSEKNFTSTTEAASLAHSVRDGLRRYITDNKLNPGDKLPSENDLIKEWEVGRTTVREAFRLLEQEGLVRSRQGLGRTLVRRPMLRRPLTRLEGITEMLASRGLVPTNTVLSVALMEPTEEEREALELTSSSTVVRLERLRRSDGTPVVYSVDVFDRSMIAAPITEIDWEESLFDILDRFDRRPDSASATISAVTLDTELAHRLEVPDTEAWLRLQQLHSDSRGRPTLVSDDLHRGSEFTFDVPRQR